MPLTLAQPALAVEAVARGDQLFVIAAAPPVDGRPFWLVPASFDLAAGERARSWIGEDAVDRSIRCRCAPCDVLALTAARAAALAQLGVWNAAALAALAGSSIVVVRAAVSMEGLAPVPQAAMGSWQESAEAPAEEGLLPALTDEAFELHRARVLAAAR